MGAEGGQRFVHVGGFLFTRNTRVGDPHTDRQRAAASSRPPREFWKVLLSLSVLGLLILPIWLLSPWRRAWTEPEFKVERTLGSVDSAARRAAQYARAHPGAPCVDEPTTTTGGELEHDAWGQRMRVSCDEVHIEARSPGADGSFDTADDIVTAYPYFAEEGAQAEVRETLRLVHSFAGMAAYGRRPPNAPCAERSDIASAPEYQERSVDSWGQRMRIICDEIAVGARSSGPDRTFGTPDDIVLRLPHEPGRSIPWGCTP
jgi:hypothetical protein